MSIWPCYILFLLFPYLGTDGLVVENVAFIIDWLWSPKQLLLRWRMQGFHPVLDVKVMRGQRLKKIFWIIGPFSLSNISLNKIFSLFFYLTGNGFIVLSILFEHLTCLYLFLNLGEVTGNWIETFLLFSFYEDIKLESYKQNFRQVTHLSNWHF